MTCQLFDNVAHEVHLAVRYRGVGDDLALDLTVRRDVRRRATRTLPRASRRRMTFLGGPPNGASVRARVDSELIEDAKLVVQTIEYTVEQE